MKSFHPTLVYSISAFCYLGFISSVANASPVKWSPYGFIKANGIGATHSIDSFGSNNLSSPTSASPTSETDAQLARQSFQVAQSRFGIKAETEKLTGTLEVDLIDFTKASPTTKAVPRIRLAKIDYAVDERNTFVAGQDWDVFSPTKPFTYNFVGLYFRTGNAGFMRQQFKWDHKTPNWRSIAAVGMVLSNNNAADSNIEKNLVPSIAYRLSHLLSSADELGISLIGATIRNNNSRRHRAIYGATLFNELKTSSAFQLNTEVYWGQNLGSAGTLTLTSSSATESQHEFGGYVSFLASLSSKFGLLGGIGGAATTNERGSPFDGNTAYRIRRNFKQEIGLEFRPEENLKIFLQNTLFQSYFTRIADQAAEKAALSNVVEVGMILSI
jgi:hypothetical protein